MKQTEFQWAIGQAPGRTTENYQYSPEWHTDAQSGSEAMLCGTSRASVRKYDFCLIRKLTVTFREIACWVEANQWHTQSPWPSPLWPFPLTLLMKWENLHTPWPKELWKRVYSSGKSCWLHSLTHKSMTLCINPSLYRGPTGMMTMQPFWEDTTHTHTHSCTHTHIYTSAVSHSNGILR